MESYEERLKQEEEKRKNRKVYSSELIDKLIRDRSLGYDIPYDAFYNRDLDLRAPGVTFKMTDYEMEEYQKCYDDAVYFVGKYCRFMTDKGLAPVVLRDFQKKIIKIVTDEVYLPDIDDFGPKNRNVIWTAARQSGKCCSYNTQINTNNKIQNIGETFNIYKNNTSFLSKLKACLYKIYAKI